MGRKRSIFTLKRDREKKALKAAYGNMQEGADRTAQAEAMVVQPPTSDKVVVKQVPAMADGEVVGTTLIYEDGTMDIIVKAGISDAAKEHLEAFKLAMMAQYDYEPKIQEAKDGPA